MAISYRLGLDLGANSIGWCAVKLDGQGSPYGVLDAGVRILTPNDEAGRDPQSKASLTANRRTARSMRRRRDRFLRRRKRLMTLLIDNSLMPEDEQERKALERLDPYWLRAAALDQRLDAHEVGRVLFHLNQRRGFKSNRIADTDDSEKSATRDGMRDLEQALCKSGARTLGEFLAKRHRRDKDGHRLLQNGKAMAPEAVRFRPSIQGTRNLYDFYPSRDLIAAELTQIWETQAAHHECLTPELFDKLKRVILEQRPLKKPLVGRCTLRPDAQPVRQYGIDLDLDLGERAPKAHPLFQRFRILQDVAQLRVVLPGMPERPLSLPERDMVAAYLMNHGGSTIELKKLRSAADLPDNARFNYEQSGRVNLPPDQTAAKLAAKKAFGKRWRALPRERQIEVVERLLAVADDVELTDWLRKEHGLSDAEAETVSTIRLPQGHGKYGRSALADLVQEMEKQSKEAEDPNTGEVYERPLTCGEAVAALSRHHSNLRPEEKSTRLPYYGEALVRHVVSLPAAPEGSQERIGRVPNPTVHIGLNQVRRLVNALINKYGRPQSIAIELARELKLSKTRKAEIQKENKKNEQKNIERRERLANLRIRDTHDGRLRLRLFDELPCGNRVCVFTGKPLSTDKLFDGTIEIEHILPYSRTLDDSFMNKVLCMREANRRKASRSPAEAWSGDELQKIVERAAQLFPKKAWRFQPDAMSRFGDNSDFLARHLTDSQHMAVLAKAYLEHVCRDVQTLPGRLTAMLRARWGLNTLLPYHNYTGTNQKNRKDHRHHAIDAFVVACTDRGLFKRIEQAAGRDEKLNLGRLFPKGSFPDPYDDYRNDLEAFLNNIIVSHKADHGLPPSGPFNRHATSGQLHKETAYGIVEEEINGKRYNLVTRKPVEALTRKEIDSVRDDALREELRKVDDDAKQAGQEWHKARDNFAKRAGIRRVRVLMTNQSVCEVRHGSAFTKAYIPGDNHCVELFELPDGSWSGEGVTVYDAHQPSYAPAWRREHPDAKLVMRVHKGDLIEANFGEGTEIYRVFRLEPTAKRFRLAAHNEAGSMASRHGDPDDPLRWLFATWKKLQGAAAKRVRVDILGRVTAACDAP